MASDANDPGDWAADAEDRLLDGAMAHAARLGWNRRLVAAAARETGLKVAEAELLLPEGARDLAALLSRRHDLAALEALSTVDPAALKMRERIRRAVMARCDAAAAAPDVARGWTGFLVLPTNLSLGLRLAWMSADRLWRWAGDVAADENHYSKRILLAEILISTLAIRLAGDEAAAARHLDRRIAGVIGFERWKGRLRAGDAGSRLAGLLGRLRYGSARV